MEFPWLDQFCGSPFWDTNRTWDTNNPYFTPCFEQTALVFLPALVILLVLPFELYWRLCSSERNSTASIPFSPLNVTKGILTTSLIILQLVILYPVIFSRGNNADNEIDSIEYPVELYSPIIKATTYMLALFLLLLTKAKGIRSSGSLFLFWTITLICECITFRSIVSSPDNDGLGYTYANATLYIVNIISFVCIVALFLLNCWADAAPSFMPKFDHAPLKSSGPPSPEKNASFLSQLLFEWFTPLAWKGYKRPLDYMDLWELNEEDRASAIVPAFIYNLNQAKMDKTQGSGVGLNRNVGNKTSKNDIPCSTRHIPPKKKSTEVSVLPILFKTFGSTFVFGCCLKMVPDLMVFVSPLILQQLIAFVNEPDGELWKGMLFAGVMFSSAIIQTILTAQYSHRIYISGLRVRTALVNAIYRKALFVSNGTKRGTTLGEIVNLMSVDVQKIMDLTPFINYLWSSPIQIIIAIYFQWGILGPSVLAGLAVMILIIPINALIIGKQRKYQVIQMKYKDQRVKLMNEILSGIKVLKLYAWEPSFQSQIEAIRNKEVHVLRLAAILSAGMNFLWMCAPFMVSVATFATFVLIDENNVLDATKAFVSLSLFSVINFSVSLLPNTIQMLVLALVSLKRINRFMNCEEVDPKAVSHDLSEGDPVVIENGNFTWDQDNPDSDTPPRPFLKDINLRIRPGSCVAVVGAVGSGKSTLLSAVIGETSKLSGRVNTIGTIAYVAQQAWIQNVTLRDNILFGMPYDLAKYERVLRACALKPDIAMLPAGDKTEIGEKGINLSGGQKQRVAIARAVYSNSEIYLLDDPLSAVDSHVGKHIFEKVLGPKGLLKNKTRILVTHGVVFLPEVDQIVVLREGEISEIGTYQQLLDAQVQGGFAEFLEQHAIKEEDEGDDKASDLEGSASADSAERNRQLTTSATESEKSVKTRRTSAASVVNKLIETETSETESVQFSVYFTYFKAAGWDLTILTLVLYTLFQGFSVGANMCLSDWSNIPVVNGTQDRGQRDKYLGIYGGLGVLQGIAIGFASAAMALGILKSATVLHHGMLYRILRCPMFFFDTTPLGRIVNRFSKDIDTLDAILPLTLRMFMNGLFQVMSTLVVISYTTPMFVAIIIPIGIVYYLVQKFYVSTSRQLKRLESVTRSPIYSHFGESVLGSPTIRAYRQDERFILETEAKVDFNQKSYYPSVSSNRWLAVRLETVGNLVIFFAALFAVLSRDTLSPGLVGLSVTYALQITLALNMVVRWISELETNLVAVERIKEYSEIPQEAPWEIDSRKPQKEWPENGQVEFNGYKSRYREGLELVLRNITCTIQPGEKIGIVGRTGAGKSSLTLGLFRIVEAAGGSIKIDGIDIGKLGLHDVRGRITIIPQDPVLFSGTFRLNLDPFEKYSDDELWRALELAHLKPFVKTLPLRLQHEISEGGENLSVGQRQLVCLARALLRKTRILVLDEATAAVDLELDDMIQATIRKEFKDSTVLTIAHRLNTIMDSTRVIVLDKGDIREFDSPENLLSNTHSIFYSMAKDAGLCS